MLRGETQQYRATGQFSDGTAQDLTARVTWASANPAIATVDASGRASGVAVGSTTITATLGAVTGSTSLTVNPPLLQQVWVTPISPARFAGETVQFTATGTFSDGTTQDLTATATWTSSRPSVATIASTGLATGVGQGTTFIRATVGLVYGETSLTVLSATPLTAITVTRVYPPTDFGIVIGDVASFTATGQFQDSSSQDLTPIVTWTSPDPTRATVVGPGRLQGLRTGTATITAARDSLTGGGSVVFLGYDALELAPSTPTRTVGQTLQMTAFGRILGTDRRDDVTSLAGWTSSNLAVATISGSGLVTALAPGTTTITAVVCGVSLYAAFGSTTLTVTPTLTAITVPPAAVGLTIQLQALGTFSDQSTRDLTALVTWATSNPAVATISPAGLVTTVGQGVAALTAARP